VNIRRLNKITLPDIYSLPLQNNLIAALKNYSFINIVDYTSFFYQFLVHPSDRYKLAIINHRGQKIFNIAPINYRNSSLYIQRLIDRILRPHRLYIRAYVNNLMIFSFILKDYLAHLDNIFSALADLDIILSPKKLFLGYFII